MNPCDDCSLDDKIYNCCGRYPPTGETVRRTRSNHETAIYACPYLDDTGKCAIYEQRPLNCRTYFCSRYTPSAGIGSDYWDVIEALSALY